MHILVLNSGSSSIKYQLFEMVGERTLARGRVERIGMDDAVHHHEVDGRHSEETASVLDHAQAVRRALAALVHAEHGVIRAAAEIAGVGHRFVHGGEWFTESTAITPEVRQQLRKTIDLAPLHVPANLTGYDAARALLPDVAHVAVFDTAFHATMPRHAYLYALPYVLYKRHRIRRYGFHGTSHRYVAERAAALLGRRLEELKLISCHLGNGASVCAIQAGRSMDTSMGFTPLEGLVMGSRSGDLDPAVVLHVMAREELGLSEMNALLNKHSGLWGISGISSDMREIVEEMQAGDARARDAFDIFEYRLRKYIGAYLAALDGADAIIFTGGIGENSVELRAQLGSRLGYVGVSLDEAANAQGEGERIISTPDSKIALLVIPTNEELMIARETAARIMAAGA